MGGASEYAQLQSLITDTAKALRESQGATPNLSPKEHKGSQQTATAHAVAPVPEPAKRFSLIGPKHASKEQQAMIIKQLTVEEDRLAQNVKAIKAAQKKEQAQASNTKELEGLLKGKDKEMLTKFDAFSKRSSQKAALGAMDVISKLKRVVHFVKKGALSGNQRPPAASTA